MTDEFMNGDGVQDVQHKQEPSIVIGHVGEGRVFEKRLESGGIRVRGIFRRIRAAGVVDFVLFSFLAVVGVSIARFFIFVFIIIFLFLAIFLGVQGRLRCATYRERTGKGMRRPMIRGARSKYQAPLSPDVGGSNLIGERTNQLSAIYTTECKMG